MATPKPTITFQQQAEAFREKKAAAAKVAAKPPPAVNSQTSNPNLPVVGGKKVSQLPINPEIRKTVAPVEPREPREPREPKAVSATPVRPAAPTAAPNPSPNARRHSHRNARFNRPAGPRNPAVKLWVEGLRAAALAARTKYETDNPKPARKTTK